MPIVLNPGPHLFMDEFLVESSSNVVRRVNPPVRNPALANPIVTGGEDQNFQPYLSGIREDKTWRLPHVVKRAQQRFQPGQLAAGLYGIERWNSSATTASHHALPRPGVSG